MTIHDDIVREHSSSKFNRTIDFQLIERLRIFYAQDKEAISRRIQQLEAEWHIDRAVMAKASIVGATGLLLGALVHRRWLAITGAAVGFLLHHSAQGWSAPAQVFRGFGMRSSKEIERERYALKYLRGDFDGLDGNPQLPERLYTAVSL